MTKLVAVEKGLENVTVEDITAEADVSLRTFGNYFSSKYEAICAIGTDRARRIGATLLARPADEPLWEAISSPACSFKIRPRRNSSACGIARSYHACHCPVLSPAVGRITPPQGSCGGVQGRLDGRVVAQAGGLIRLSGPLD